MISLREWLENVETNWSPEEGLFNKDDPKYIADYLLIPNNLLIFADGKKTTYDRLYII